MLSIFAGRIDQAALVVDGSSAVNARGIRGIR
ncbi:hypothetical protein F0726_00313 [Acidithiobacillus caldus]|nr:hypothetical protein F0726_00313 [Acidithiobacillus caldus]